MKKDGTVKARGYANGSMQRFYIPKEEVTSLIVEKDSALITGVIEAKQKRDVIIIDISNGFVQISVPPSNDRN